MTSFSKAHILYFLGGRTATTTVLPRKFAGIFQCWRAQGHTVEWLCGYDLLPNGPLKSPPAQAQHRRGRLPWYRRTGIIDPIVESISERRDVRENELCIEHLRRMIKQQRFDLIWERSVRLHRAGLAVAQEFGIPTVFEWKDNIIQYRYSWYHSRAMAIEAQKPREASCVVVESEVLRGHLSREGIDPAKIIVAHNAVDPELFHRDPAARQATRRKLGVAEDEVLAGYLGGYQFYHDPIRLVLAADLLRKRNQRKLKILMIGDGTEYFKTRQLADKLGLTNFDRFTMMPWIPQKEVPGILAALDVAVLPGSTDIICPIKIQEYMATELPSVLPDYAANREVITQGETGLLFRPGDEVALAEALNL